MTDIDIVKNNNKVLRSTIIEATIYFVLAIGGVVALIFILERRLIETFLFPADNAYFLLLLPFCVLFGILFCIKDLIEYRTLKKASADSEIKRKSDKGLRIAFSIGLGCILFFAVIRMPNFETFTVREFTGELNFPTVSEAFPQKDWSVDPHGHITLSSTLVAPNVQFLHESLWLRGSGGVTDVPFVYNVNSYEMRTEFLAKLFERELRRGIGESPAVNMVNIEIVDKKDVNLGGIDSAVYYSFFYSICDMWLGSCNCDEHERFFEESLIMRIGNTLITVRYDGSESLLDSVNLGRFN
jgi:hypothetical protein